MTTKYLLTGDIGGTNSRMGLYDTCTNIPLAVKYYANQEYLPEVSEGLFEKNIIAPFLQYCWSHVDGLEPIERSEIVACLAIAGVVNHNKVVVTNLDNLSVDGDAIVKGTYVTGPYIDRIVACRIINDFVAQGYGCLTLEPHEVRDLTPGSHELIDPKGPKVCVGAGTGLGECYLTYSADGSYETFPSEGGHVEFSPRNDLEIKLLKFLKNKFGSNTRISVERVVSGKGLANVYDFMTHEWPDKINKKIHDEFLKAGDQQGKVVATNTRNCELCKKTVEIMFSAYGSECGNAAIKWIPTGGLFVTGGLTPKNIHHIEPEDSYFRTAYRDKGRVSPILEKIPLFAVMVEDLGVRGAHKCALIEYEKLKKLESNPAQPPEKRMNSYASLVLLGAAAVAVGALLNRKK